MSEMRNCPDSSKSLMVTSPSQLQPVRPNKGSSGSSESDQGISVQFALNAVRQWWKIASPLGFLLAAIGGTLVYVFYVPVYRADAWFRIDDVVPYLAFPSEQDARRSHSFVQTQIELIRGPLVLGPVVGKPEISALPEIEEQQNPIEWLSQQIQVNQLKDSELFTISFESPDPANAALVANEVATTYFNLRAKEEAERRQRVVELLQDEKERRHGEVRLLRENLRELTKQATGKDPFVASPLAESTVSHPLLADLLSRLVTVEVEQEVLRAELEPLQRNAEQPAEVPDWMVERAAAENTEVQRLKADLLAKRTALHEIKSISAQGEKAPAYLQLSEEIGRDETTLEEIRAEIKEGVKAEMEAVLASSRKDELAQKKAQLDRYGVQEKLLRQRYESELGEVQSGTGDTLDLEFKRSELAQAEQVFDLISARALQLQVEGGALDRVRLMRPATTPTAPLQVVPYRNMALASFAGLCLPFILAVGWERAVRRISDRQYLERQSNLVVVGEIARLPARPSRSHGSSSRRIGQAFRVFEESVDSLRTSLVLSEDLKDMRVLAVTSAVIHEGKTSVAAQLAVSIARASSKPTLLIDGDLRSPGIHSVFEIPLEPGLAEVLEGTCALEDATATGWSEYVHLVPAGRLRVNPHKLLGNGAIKSLLNKALSSYRYIILDTPPILAAGEALILAKAADASLICAMRDVSRSDQVRRAHEQLATIGARLVGTVLSGVPTKRYVGRYGSYAYSHD